jgi:hypothetical protein
MGLAFIPLYIKYHGIEAYGLIGLFALLQAWLGLLDMGMTPILGREMARFTGGTGVVNIRSAAIHIYLRVLTIRIHPTSPAFMRVAGVLQGRLLTTCVTNLWMVRTKFQGGQR